MQFAVQNQGLASNTYLAGVTRERQGLKSGNVKAIEEGLALQAKGKEMEASTYRHLNDAMHDIRNIDIENRTEPEGRSEPEYQNEIESPQDGGSQDNSYIIYEQSGGGFNAVVGDAIRVGGSKSAPHPQQVSVNGNAPAPHQGETSNKEPAPRRGGVDIVV